MEEIEVETGPVAFTSAGIKKPALGVEGKFSLWFLSALALAEGDVRLDKFTDEKVNDPVIEGLRQKVNAELVRELKLGARVKVSLQDGTAIQKARTSPKGSPENPLTFQETEKKFRDTARLFLSERGSEALIAQIQDLDRMAHGRDLTEVFHAEAQS